MTSDRPDLIQRAAARLPAMITGQGGYRIDPAMQPLVVNARSLGSDSPLQWGSTLRSVSEISVPETQARSSITLFSAKGALIMSMVAPHWRAFYVECRLHTPAPGTAMHWDVNFGPDPVAGEMVRVSPGSDEFYFATPFARDPDLGHLQISQKTPPQDRDERWTFYEMVLLPVLAP
ncbi:hypothetical protein M3P36_02855 [Altererythrobacter sp. KTW20L]|uniref:hypothetical protein n=1 Tax=Altererythrobacter sp. KTW20L TaxID=2942210 RepID=UPI0020BFCE94|nr:hypothetical protein [Altererythrobacter sp. KTW20L]MCL6249991.1 hypothetical protein [Altererythrobacter sp. KTW20L]